MVDIAFAAATMAQTKKVKMHPSPLGTSAPAVDTAVLEDLLGQVDADEAMRDDLIASYLSETTDQLAILVKGAGLGDADSVARVAHSLRSASALLGALPFAALLLDAEAVARTAPARLADVTRPLEAEYRRVMEEFDKIRSSG